MARSNVIFFVLILICIRLTTVKCQTVTDADGNLYATIAIGHQVWMAENLKTTRYNDDKEIPLVIDDKIWKSFNKPALCWYNNDLTNKDVYGALYNWYAVSTKKLCPKGWHVPTDPEWTIMIDFLGDIKLAGDKLKETGSAHWKNTLNEGTNDYDFTALPGGMRFDSGTYPLFGSSYAVWWTATAFNATDAWNRGLYYTSSRVYKGHESIKSGFSVRCMKD